MTTSTETEVIYSAATCAKCGLPLFVHVLVADGGALPSVCTCIGRVGIDAEEAKSSLSAALLRCRVDGKTDDKRFLVTVIPRKRGLTM